ncbi:MAG: hypothetical protein LUD27_00705 [Clostridia bacterium]|nr:hypothetical protein [Clostridia bacterium]
MTDEQEVQYFTRDEARLDDHQRRIEALEAGQKNINELTQSVKILALNMEHMLTEQKEQGERLKKLEAEPVETAKYYRKTFISCAVTAVISTVIGAVIGLFI